jgi:hypothetical protein
MSSALQVLLVRILLPVGTIVFALFFYRGIEDMGRSEKLFPIVLIAGISLIAILVIVREAHAFFVVGREDKPGAARQLDIDGLRTLGWRRSTLVAGACLLYVVAIDRLGLLVTAFLVYMTCAATLIPDRSGHRDWIFSLVGAVAVAILFDLVFRVWLGLHLPGPMPG